MNIKGVNNFEPADSVNLTARRTDIAKEVVSYNSENIYKDLSPKDISGIVDRLNNGVREMHERLSFSFHEKTGRIIVKVLDPDTNEVIREIPSKDAIKLLEHIQDFLGMIVDETR